MKTQESKHGKFYKLLASLPDVNKEDLVWQYSNMVTISLQELYANNIVAYNHMIADLENLVKNNQDYIKKLRSGVLHRMQKLGVNTTNWQDVNLFLNDKRIAGKLLYELSCDELNSLIMKLESMLAKQIIKSREVQRLKQCN